MKNKIWERWLGLWSLGLLAGFPTAVAADTAGKANPAYTVAPTKKAPVIDGKLDDTVWAGARFTHLYDFLASTTEKKIIADPSTTFAISADDKQLYVAFRCQDTNVDKLEKGITTYDGKIWNGDNVEIFLNFDRDGHSFGRVILGASGALFDAAYLQYGLKEQRWFNIKGLAGATDIQEDHWTGEIAIPFAGLAMKPDASGNWPIHADPDCAPYTARPGSTRMT